MGCSESQLAGSAQQNIHESRQFAQIRPVGAEEEGFGLQQFNDGVVRTPKKITFVPGDVSVRSRENQDKSLDDNGETSKIHVKKAKNYRIRPEHEKFIENILESNRGKAITEFPPSSNKSNFAPPKKTVTSLYGKPEESAINKQNVEGHQQKLQKSMVSPKSDGKLSKKEAEKIMNNVLLGKMDHEELNRIGEGFDLEQMDSNATLQL